MEHATFQMILTKNRIYALLWIDRILFSLQMQWKKTLCVFYRDFDGFSAFTRWSTCILASVNEMCFFLRKTLSVVFSQCQEIETIIRFAALLCFVRFLRVWFHFVVSICSSVCWFWDDYVTISVYCFHQLTIRVVFTPE